MGFIFAFIGFYILFVFYCGLYLLLLGFIGFYILFGFIFAFIAEICLFSQAREWGDKILVSSLFLAFSHTLTS